MTRKRAFLLIGTVCLLTLLLPSRIASAHVFLKSSDPASDQVLAQAPTQIILTFSGDLKTTSNQITVTDANQQHFETGNVIVSVSNHAVMSIAVKSLPEGIYTVTYTAVSDADGHETLDNFRFGVGNVKLVSDVPNRACAMLPPVTPPSDSSARVPDVRIVSPFDNSALTSAHLDYTIETDNFNLGSNGNYADVWLDGQKVGKIQSIGGHSLDLTNGIHDLCISLVDGQNQEIGARTGVRLVVSGAASSANTGNNTIIITVGVVIVVLIIALAYLITRRPYKVVPK